jgi:hypothetical protein
MIIISTDISDDGVIGLNGKRYVIDENKRVKKFKSISEAMDFIREQGVDPHSDYIEYEEYDPKVQKEKDTKAFQQFIHGKKDDTNSYPDDMYDDAEALASAGHGTDEDYGHYGEDTYL